MWIRKSDLEIQVAANEKEQKRTSLARPLYWAVPITLICMVLFALGYRGGLSRGVIIYSSPSSLFSSKMLLLAAFVFCVLYLAMSFYQRKGSTFFSGDDILLCGDCQEPAHATINKRCPCGGSQEPFAYYTWEEDEA